jgi:hypothetical protein
MEWRYLVSDPMMRAEIPLPKPSVHPGHPFKNQRNHDLLMDYLRSRLKQGVAVRDNKLARLASVDKMVAGWMRLNKEDRARKIKEERTGYPQAVQMNLPLTFVHLDDMMTYFAQTFAPNRGMFYSVGKPDEQDAGSQIVTIMNNHAIYAGYFRQVLLAIFACLKHNEGGFYCNWSKDIGPKLAKGPQDQTVLNMETIWNGNRVTALDTYNTFYDPICHPTELYCKGEWAARAWPVSHYMLQKMASEGLYYNCETAIETEEGLGNCTYYRNPPSEANMDANESGAVNNWVAILSMAPAYAMSNGFELVEVSIRLNPYQLNLVPRTAANKATRNRFELWRITILNDKYIIDATYMNNIHGYLPYFIGMINDDLMSTSQKSVAEILAPLQNFASFLLNTHVAATRKNIWGLTVYDSTVVDLSTLPAGETSARVPAKPSAAGKKISDAIYEHQGTLDTKQTMSDLEAVFGIISQFFPTQSLPSQIASIDRAVDSQVAAVQQGANRRMQKGAKLLDDSLFRPLRFCMYYNIIQYQEDGVAVTDFYGKPQVIDLSKLRETDLPFIIGQGLKAIDKQMVASQLQNIIFAIIQNQTAAQQIDVLGIIDYWTSMIDIDIDMEKFRIQPPAGVGPDGQPLPAGGAVTPLTNPLAMTAPLVKPGVDSVQ